MTIEVSEWQIHSRIRQLLRLSHPSESLHCVSEQKLSMYPSFPGYMGVINTQEPVYGPERKFLPRLKSRFAETISWSPNLTSSTIFREYSSSIALERSKKGSCSTMSNFVLTTLDAQNHFGDFPYSTLLFSRMFFRLVFPPALDSVNDIRMWSNSFSSTG